MCPKIRANYSLIIVCSDIGTPNNHHFPFGTNGKVVMLGVPILKGINRVTKVRQKLLLKSNIGSVQSMEKLENVREQRENFQVKDEQQL